MFAVLGEKRGRTDCKRTGGYWRQSTFEGYNDGSHGDDAGHKGRIGGGQPFSGRGQRWTKPLKRKIYFGCPVSTVCQLDRKPFLPAAALLILNFS